MADTRTEHDLLGKKALPENALYGIHTLRAIENFPIACRPVNRLLVHAYGLVKLACLRMNHRLSPWPENEYAALSQACDECAQGALDEHIVVDALQGGAGTSTNMNINEVIVNRALTLLGKSRGDYAVIDPIRDINRHQSTNDTYPTALKVAAIGAIDALERALVMLLESFQRKEKEFADIVKVGRTQMQDAVLITLGREMGAYAEAIGRDRWRLYKCKERLRVVNLGGTAVGTGIGAPRQFIFGVVEELRALTAMGLSRAENLVDATQNTDVFAEVHGLLKTCATNFAKIAGDIRFMSSGPEAGVGEISLPPLQAGSSIMPGKVNPVIPESVTQAAIAVMANDVAINQACAGGSLELNAFLPLIADRLLESIELLTRSAEVFACRCISGIQANSDRCKAHVGSATAVTTALAAKIGYKRAQEIEQCASRESTSIRQVAIEKGYCTAEQFDTLITPEQVNRLGE